LCERPRGAPAIARTVAFSPARQRWRSEFPIDVPGGVPYSQYPETL
jgi:hypothetical protein